MSDPTLHTERTILAALEKRYNETSGYALIPQVRDSTGYDKRTADAVAVQLWPSRGVTLTGFEIKVSRGDWRRELTSDKAEPVAAFCHYWIVVAPAGVIPPKEIPPGWGHTEVRDDGSLRTRCAPPLQDALKPNLPFIAALLRRVAKGIAMPSDALAAARAQGHAAAMKHAEDANKGIRDELAELKEAALQYREATGIDFLTRRWSPDPAASRLGNGLLALARLKQNPRSLRGMRDLASNFEERARTIRRDLDTIEAASAAAIAHLSAASGTEP